MSKIFQHLDIKGHEIVSEKLYQYVLNHTDILERKVYWNTLNLEHVRQHVPELFQTVSQAIPTRMFMIAIFYAPPKFSGGVHIDAGELVHRVLWPVHNCQGSYTKFFDLNGNNLIEKLSGDCDPYLSVNDENPLTEIASVETTAPFIFNVKIPHGIYTNPELTGPRLTATMGFDGLENFYK